MIAPNTYRTWIFDCDGVLLDSNAIKTDAFREIALPFGEAQAGEMVAYHQRFGGISRFEKIQYFFDKIAGQSYNKQTVEDAVQQFGEICLSKLSACSETRGMREFIERIPEGQARFVVSGGRQDELRHVFVKRQLQNLFTAIYGSPADKLTILQRMKDAGELEIPAVFVGDSKYDYEAAHAFGIDFIFMTTYTEFFEWQDFFRDKPEVQIVDFLPSICNDRRTTNNQERRIP